MRKIKYYVILLLIILMVPSFVNALDQYEAREKISDYIVDSIKNSWKVSKKDTMFSIFIDGSSFDISKLLYDANISDTFLTSQSNYITLNGSKGFNMYGITFYFHLDGSTFYLETSPLSPTEDRYLSFEEDASSIRQWHYSVYLMGDNVKNGNLNDFVPNLDLSYKVGNNNEEDEDINDNNDNNENSSNENDTGFTVDNTLKASNICIKTSYRTLMKFIGWIVGFFKILVPILIILFGAIDLYKAIIAQKDDAIKKAAKSIAIRAIAGVFIFLLPGLVQFVISMVTEWNDDGYKNAWCCCTDCILNSNCDVNSCDSSCHIEGMD